MSPGYDIKIAMAYFTQVADAVKLLHDKRIVHRRIASENVILFDYGRVKLCDLSKCTQLQNKQIDYEIEKNSKPVIMEHCYIAPERVKDKLVGFCSDIWSLGCLLFELLHNGYSPFKRMLKSDLKRFMSSSNLRPYDKTRVCA